MAYIYAIDQISDVQPLTKDSPDSMFYEWDTNIHYLKETEKSESVSSLEIGLSRSVYFDYFLENLNNIFGFNNFSWKSIRKMTINISGYYDSMEQKSKSDSEYEQLISQTVEYFSKYIPNIEILDIKNMSLFKPSILFGKEIYNLYATSLKEYRSHDRYINNNIVFSDRLESLEVCLDYEDCHINLKPIANSLKELTLIQQHAQIDWRVFNNGEEFSKIEYPNLHTLTLKAREGMGNSCPFSNNEREDITQDNNYKPEISTFMRAGKVVLPALTNLTIDTNMADYVQNIFCSSLYQWPNVKTLTIKSSVYAVERAIESDRFPEQSAQILYTAITQPMPNIAGLNLCYGYAYKAFFRLCSRLVEFYADQLEHLSSSIPLQINTPISSDKLETLQLNYGLDENQVLKANLTNLKHLSIYNVPHPFKWSDIDMNSSGNKLDLNHLESLGIDYDNETASWRTEFDKLIDSLNTTETQFVVSCPKLESVSIRNCLYTSLHNILGSGRNKWTNVKQLFIKIGEYNHPNVVLNSTNHPIFKTSLESIAQHIHKTLPGITDLKCRDVNHSGKPNYMFAILAQLYALKITHLDIDRPIDLNSLDMAENLVQLTLDLTDTVPSDPHIIGQNLTDLDIKFVAAPFDWRWFNIGKSNDRVNLKSLNKLSISYSNDYNDNNLENSSSVSDSVIVDMDSLEDIDIGASCASKDVMYSPCYLHLKSCKKITFSGNVDALPICASSDARFDELRVSNISENANNKDRFYQFANSWFGTTEVSTVSTLSLTNLGFELDPQEINWINLNILVVDSLVDFQPLLEVIPKLEQITILSLKKVSIKSLPAHDQSHSIRSLSNTMKFIELVDIVDCPKDIARQSVEYLVCALPTLMHILIDYEVDFDEATFVNNYHKTYPHVRDVGYRRDIYACEKDTFCMQNKYFDYSFL